MRTSRVVSSISAAVAVCLFAAAAATHKPENAANRAAKPRAEAIPKELNTIAASELRGDLSFLASDALEGRFTPSPQLDIAAEFIASEFRRAGLAPGGDQAYFQTATMIERKMPPVLTDLIAQDGPRTFSVPAHSVTVRQADHAVTLDRVPVVTVIQADPALLNNIDLSGRAVVAPVPDFAHLPRDQGMNVYRKYLAFGRVVNASSAAALIWLDAKPIPPDADQLVFAENVNAHHVPALMVSDKTLQQWVQFAVSGAAPRSITVHFGAPVDTPVVLKNVVGILRGSDPKLRDTYVMLTAHYDHIGTTATAGRTASSGASPAGDHIYNGANDDGSGTVSVIEIAKALARLPARPKRSLVFMTFFGEERGELGSHFYGGHPVVPIYKTVADVNLEQVGRTDSTNGPQVNTASLTGYDYSDVTKYLEEAGRLTGINVYRDPQASDAYFVRSDNASLALQGVPAHSLTVAFDYPDYHAVGDEWQKIDYDDMARVDRMVALGLLNIANSVTAPQWNASNPKTAEFRAAQQK